MATSVQYAALTDPIDPVKVNAFAARVTAEGTNWRPRPRTKKDTTGTLVLIFFCFVLPGLAILLSIGSALMPVPVVGQSTGLGSGLGGLVVLVFPLAGAFILRLERRNRTRGYGWDTFYRLSRFARDNNLEFDPHPPRPNYPGLLFSTWRPLEVYNHLRSRSGRYFDLGNLRIEMATSGEQPLYESRGFMAIRLERRLPNIFLDSRSNGDLFSGLIGSVPHGPTVELEGDFSRHFTLYCPPGYERDALYLLTPDLMALLIDESTTFDVEIVDDWMFVYSSIELDSTDPRVYQRLFRILETVGSKAVRRSTNYRDERIGNVDANVIARPGQRLLKRLSPAAWVIIAIIVAAVLIGLFNSFSFSLVVSALSQ